MTGKNRRCRSSYPAAVNLPPLPILLRSWSASVKGSLQAQGSSVHSNQWSQEGTSEQSRSLLQFVYMTLRLDERIVDRPPLLSLSGGSIGGDNELGTSHSCPSSLDRLHGMEHSPAGSSTSIAKADDVGAAETNVQ